MTKEIEGTKTTKKNQEGEIAYPININNFPCNGAETAYDLPHLVEKALAKELIDQSNNPFPNQK